MISPVGKWMEDSRGKLPPLEKTMDLTVPVGVLDVIVLRHGQAITSLGATALENPASVWGCHAGTKTVNAQTAADFRLVCTLGHVAWLPLKIK